MTQPTPTDPSMSMFASREDFERAKFEAWANANTPFGTQRNGEGVYVSWWIEEAWQARQTSMFPPVAAATVASPYAQDAKRYRLVRQRVAAGRYGDYGLRFFSLALRLDSIDTRGLSDEQQFDAAIDAALAVVGQEPKPGA